jgi:hypothetical protein
MVAYVARSAYQGYFSHVTMRGPQLWRDAEIFAAKGPVIPLLDGTHP